MNNMRTWWFFVCTLVALAVVFHAPEAMAQRCPRGYRLDRFRRCVPFGVRAVVCPPGYVLDRFGRCAARVISPGRACPPGYMFFRGRCIHR